MIKAEQQNLISLIFNLPTCNSLWYHHVRIVKLLFVSKSSKIINIFHQSMQHNLKKISYIIKGGDGIIKNKFYMFGLILN